MAFDLCGPLPTGTTLLEASAGTGKTFTLAALATRYVAEGVAELSELMLVTFGRAATQELRERVRERLGSAECGLADPAAALAGPDDLLRLLAQGSPQEVALRRGRLSRAVAGFDGATIATTHGFCQQMLAGLGIGGDTEPGVTFVESIADLVTEVVDDLYLRKFARPGADAPHLTHAAALSVVRRAVGDPRALLAPQEAAAGTEAGERLGIAQAARREVEARKRRARVLDYDDLIGLLRDALAHPQRGQAARERVRARFSVVLVDEFQDTDPVQWDVLRLAFHGATTLVLVGDPKQAIYAFRGGDVVTYLQAAGAATSHQSLEVNWRSDARLLEALDQVYGGAALGDERIVVGPVRAASPGSRLTPQQAPLRVRTVRRDQCGPLGRTGLPAVGRVRARVAEDLAADVVRLLTGPTRLRGEQVRPADVAVLVRTNDQGAMIRDALQAAGVPVVLSGTASVFATPSAQAWLVLLQALEQPHRAARARAAALTPFLGWTAERLDAQGDAALEELGPRLRGWAGVLATRGVAALYEVVSTDGRLTERLLQEEAGERRLTDLRHIAQALHAAGVEGSLGLTALLEWLERRRAEVSVDGAVERSRRLESDAEAVQVVTVHRSKGLEFPVVYVPYGWDRWQPRDPDPLLLHDEEGRRVLHVAGPGGPGYRERRAVHEQEEAGEELRLLYVALTRAQSAVVTWWAPSANTKTSALHRLLLGGRPVPAGAPVLTDDAVAERLAALAAASRGLIRVEPVEPEVLRWSPPPEPPAALSTGTFDRTLDTAWRRTSYSALTADAHASSGGFSAAAPGPPGVGSEPEEPELGDEPVPAGADRDEVGEPSHMADLPSGTGFGLLVHEVLETVDTSASDLPGELLQRCTDAVSGRLGELDPAVLAVALLPVLETPLGPLAAGRALRDVPPGDRLVELAFEMPLAGGDDAGGRAGAEPVLSDLAGLLRAHLPAGDPLAPYADLLEELGATPLRGYLTGSIDALLRVDGRYLVVDYKTNRLGDVLTDYLPDRMAAAMLHAHYPLQALLYAVAAHRFLRWRLPSYDVEQHLGGVLYLFVRGMSGPGAPGGVFAWRPPAGLVVASSALLDGAP